MKWLLLVVRLRNQPCFQGLCKSACRRWASYLHFLDRLSFLQSHFFANGKTPFQRIEDVRPDLFKRFALSDAARDVRHLRPIASLFRLINERFQFHGILLCGARRTFSQDCGHYTKPRPGVLTPARKSRSVVCETIRCIRCMDCMDCMDCIWGVCGATNATNVRHGGPTPVSLSQHPYY